MHRISSDKDYYADGKVVIDADGIPFEPASKGYVDQRVPIGSFTGTGSPEGKVTAPVGSVYTDSSATNGAIRWVKTSGTGNTGWRVEYGDTEERVYSDFLSSYTSSGSGRFLSRINENVRLDVVGRLLDTKGFEPGDVIGTLPAGFRPRRNYHAIIPASNVVLNVQANGQVSVVSGSASGYITFTLSHSTREPWPATLPGLPI